MQFQTGGGSTATPTGSRPCNRPRCKTCPIHHPANSFTSSCTNVTYPFTTHADCKSMNLIYQLECTECNAFYIGESVAPFPTVWMGTSPPPWYRTQTCQLSSTLSPTRSLSRNAGLLLSYTDYLTPPQTTSVASLKLHTNFSSNHNTTPVSISVNPPHSTLALAALKNFTSVSCILLLRKATVIWPKYSFSFHLYMS